MMETTDDGRWAMGDELWTMDRGRDLQRLKDGRVMVDGKHA